MSEGRGKISSTQNVCDTVVVRAINQCVFQVRQAAPFENTWDLCPTDAPLQMISLRVSSPTNDIAFRQVASEIAFRQVETYYVKPNENELHAWLVDIPCRCGDGNVSP